jgi:hypothetical protein
LRKKQDGFAAEAEERAAARNDSPMTLRKSVEAERGVAGAGAGEEGPQAGRRPTRDAAADRGRRRARPAARRRQEAGRAAQGGLTRGGRRSAIPPERSMYFPGK